MIPRERNGPKGTRVRRPAFFRMNNTITQNSAIKLPQNSANKISFQPVNNPAAAMNLMSPPPRLSGRIKPRINRGREAATRPMAKVYQGSP